MANTSRKLTSKPAKQNPQDSGAEKRVFKKPTSKARKSERQKPPLTTAVKKGSKLPSMLAIAILLSSVGLIVIFVWTSVQLIFNPDQVIWLNKVLPWGKSLDNADRPQTLKEIQENLSKQGQIAGETLPLQDTTKSFLLPVFKQRANCQTDCKYIVELRIYQRSEDFEYQSQKEEYYNLATQLPVTGPEESFVIAPLVNATSENQGSSIAMPLTEIGRFEGATPSAGIWFYLRGQRSSGTSTIAYGEIIHYNPPRTHLQQMLSWTSPNGQMPQWRQITGGGAKELVVDQTVGLEPQLRVYQVQPVKFVLNPIQLEEISLSPPALKDSAYQDALLIARNGLWTPAFEWLQFIQKQRQEKMPPAAQAQIDLIRLHSQLTKTQADKSWASPSQQVLADLIDGRWDKALQVFEASPQNAQEIATLLKADSGRLWNRVDAALQAKPDRPSVQAWGALILAAGQGRSRANSWLKSQPKTTKDTLAKIESLFKQLNGEPAKPQISTHPTRIVGSATPISEINAADWLQLSNATDLKATPNQWFQVEITAFHDGKSWLYAPFTNLNPPTTTAKFLWETLGINSDPTIQIVLSSGDGEQQTTKATIKGVQLRGGVLRLLAAADQTIPAAANNMQPLPLALTNTALQWVQPSPITVEQLYQQNPAAVKAMLPAVWRGLQASGELTTNSVPDFLELRRLLGYWPVQLIDLTLDEKPETVLTISPDAITSLNASKPQPKERNKNQSRPRTLILSDGGKVIYTDFKENSFAALTAIAKLSDGQSLALLVENADKYSLKSWSVKNQRFE